MAAQSTLLYESPLEGSSVVLSWDDAALTCSGGHVIVPLGATPLYIALRHGVRGLHWIAAPPGTDADFGFTPPLPLHLIAPASPGGLPGIDIGMVEIGCAHAHGSRPMPAGATALGLTRRP